MKILLCWSDSYDNDFDHEEFECTGDIDFEVCDHKLWKLVQDDGFIVSICKIDDEK